MESIFQQNQNLLKSADFFCVICGEIMPRPDGFGSTNCLRKKAIYILNIKNQTPHISVRRLINRTRKKSEHSFGLFFYGFAKYSITCIATSSAFVMSIFLS